MGGAGAGGGGEFMYNTIFMIIERVEIRGTQYPLWL